MSKPDMNTTAGRERDARTRIDNMQNHLTRHGMRAGDAQKIAVREARKADRKRSESK